MCLCIKEVENLLIKAGNGVRILEKDNKSLKVTDLFLNSDNQLRLEHYDVIELSDLKALSNNEESEKEDKINSYLESVSMWTLDGIHDLGKLQALSNEIISEFDILKLSKMERDLTLIDFSNSNLDRMAFLAYLN